MPGGGDFCFVFSTRGRSFALKSCPGRGDFDGKISGPGVIPGGTVTGQIDTCIKHRRKASASAQTGKPELTKLCSLCQLVTKARPRPLPGPSKTQPATLHLSSFGFGSEVYSQLFNSQFNSY